MVPGDIHPILSFQLEGKNARFIYYKLEDFKWKCQVIKLIQISEKRNTSENNPKSKGD